jgi:phosphopantothenoylcysteine decarboxylase/phosphopantothenate--cysteine ligase
VIAPAMNVHMWQNPVNQRNLDYLRSLEYLICTPGEGFLAEGYSGKGRLADLEHLIQYLYRAIHPEATSLKGKKVLVTAGGTEEPLDPVRIFTNRSSGKMGYALAWEAFARGAEVTLIHGLSDVPDPVDLSIIGVKTAAEMFKAVQEQLPSADIYLSAAAIADFTPREVQKGKIKKQEGDLNITFKKTSDVLQYAGEHKLAHQQLIGFAVETDDPENQARKKMNQKNLDMIVLNNPLEKGAEFGSDTNKVILFHKNGNSEQVTTMPKVDIAFRIFDFLLRNQ